MLGESEHMILLPRYVHGFKWMGLSIGITPSQRFSAGVFWWCTGMPQDFFKYKSRDQKKPKLTYNTVCIYSYKFKLQSPSKYSPFETFFPRLKSVFERIDSDAF